jgi:hypothetical protein
MKNLMTQTLAVAAVFVASPKIASVSAETKGDVRVERLHEFLEEKDSPIQHLAADFVRAADQNQLDWRLLPSISFVESTAGKHYKNNNIFGWDNGEHRFPSVRQSIYTVARKLGHARSYRNKQLDRILAAYNPRPEYRTKVRKVMREIGPRMYAANYPKPSRSSFR